MNLIKDSTSFKIMINIFRLHNTTLKSSNINSIYFGKKNDTNLFYGNYLKIRLIET